MLEKITLVCTSLNPDDELTRKMVISSKGFDETLLHRNKESIEVLAEISEDGIWWEFESRIKTPNHLSIPEAYNLLIKNVKTEWVCCFCDDDYFYPEGLTKMIAEVHKGIDADVAHFKFHVSGYIPPEDTRGRLYRMLGKNEYDLCEPRPITPKLLEKHGRMPAGSFFRKSAWEKVGGFQGDKCHDWDLWKRMAQAGCTFKYFDYKVYNMVRRKGGAWEKQNARMYSENT